MTDENGLDTFINVSLKYSELNAIKYEADRDRISLEVVLKDLISYERQEQFISKIKSCLLSFYKLAHLAPEFVDFNFDEKAGITFFRIYRDMSSLSEGEINLCIVLLNEEFADLLLTDDSSIIAKESFKKQVKNDLLQKVHKNDIYTNSFFACRDKGRVFVFNE